MNIQITSGTATITHRLRQHVEQRLGLALGRFASRIRSVSVSFVPQGPKMKLCRIGVELRKEVSVEAAGIDMFSAVDLATDHVTRRIARAIELENAASSGRAGRAAIARGRR